MVRQRHYILQEIGIIVTERAFGAAAEHHQMDLGEGVVECT